MNNEEILAKEKVIRETRRKTVEEVWKILNDFRKYDPYNIGADTNALKARLEELGGEGCNLPFNIEE